MKHALFGRALALALAVATAGCGGERAVPAATQAAAGSAEPTFLAGIHASDIAKAVRIRGIVCAGPVQEVAFQKWVCEAQTPLIAYLVECYGKAPGRIEYIRVVVTQSGPPKVEQILPVLLDIANLPYTDVDRTAATAWVQQTFQSGGQTRFGPAKLKLSGNLSRVVFEVKAPGSEW